MKYIDNSLKDMDWDLARQEVKITNMWAIINKDRAFNERHHHGNSSLSAAYYVKAPENCGNIHFYEPNEVKKFQTPPVEKMTELSSTGFSIKPEEGNLLIFNIDIVKSNTDTRFIIRSLDSLEKTFVKNNYKFNIYTNFKNMDELKNNIFAKKESSNFDNCIDVFITVDQKLVNFNFNKYSIKSYKKLDDLNKSKILDYSLEIS